MNKTQQLEEFNFLKYWQILKYHRLAAIGVFLLTCIIATVMAITTEKKYEAKANIKFTKESIASALVTEAGKEFSNLETFTPTATPVDTEAEVLMSPTILKEVIAKLKLVNDEGKSLTFEDLRANLNVTNVPGTDILNINYASSDTEEAEKIVNAIIDAYLNYDVETNRTQAKSAREFINQQLPQTEKELQIAEANLRRFQERYGLINIDAETEQTVYQISGIDEQIASAKARLSKVEGQVREAEQQLGISSQEALALNTINDSPIIQQVLVKLKEVEDRLAVERSRFQDSNPVIASLEAQKAELEKELQNRVQESLGGRRGVASKILQQQTGDVQEVLTEQLVGYEVERQSLQEEIRSLEGSKNNYRARANLLPQLEQKHRELQRKVEASQSAYNTLLNNLQQVQILANQNVGNAQVLSNAVISKYPVSLSRKLIIAGGMGLGAVLGVITAFLLELRNPSLKTAQELRQTYQYKLLGTTPNQQSQNFLGFSGLKALPPERSIAEEPYSIASEAYRMLHTNLQFLNDSDVKVITISSSIPQEGKSTVSANLAAAIAQIGKKVLIIDADLHRPQQHSIWGASNHQGLAEILREEASVNSVIQSIIPNIEVITSGMAQPGESSILLKAKAIRQIIEQVEEDYDLIIFDTPPVLLFTDALTITGQTEGIVMVSRPGVTTPASAKASKELLDQSGYKVLGLVVNSVSEESDTYYKYAKGYYHRTSGQLQLPQKIS